MDNITHAFVGAAMADALLPAGVPSSTRRVFVVTGVVAASAPDVDLALTSLTEPPLGFLLHHRGHTHTLPGLVALGLMILFGLRVWPFARRALAGRTGHVVLLIGAAL